MRMQKNSANPLHSSRHKRPAHQSVYSQLRDQILFGELAPGQAVTIQGIAEELDAGMTPVREAIRRLTSDGALNMMGNRRIMVPEMTESCIEQLEFMRKKLEPELAVRAVSYIAPTDMDDLRHIDSSLNDAIEKGDIHSYLAENYRFHARLNAVARAPVIAATVEGLWLRFGPSLRVVCGRYGTMSLPDKHSDLLMALADGDPQAAKKAMTEDVSQAMLKIREALQEGPAAGDSIDSK